MKEMKNHIEVEIIIDTLLISNVHKTVTSILSQHNLATLGIHLRFTNKTHLDLKAEKASLLSAGIKIIDQPSNARFFLTINSGTIISPSFLYKGLHYLLRNHAIFVCPEYTFRRIDETLDIITVQNDQMLFKHVSPCLIDRRKIQESKIHTPRTSIIKDTCSALITINISFSEYTHQLEEQHPFFNSSLFLPQYINNTQTPPLFQSTIHVQSFKHKIINLIKSSAGRSKILQRLLRTQPNNFSPIHTTASPYISNQMRNELEQLSRINYSLKGYSSMHYIDLTYETFLKSEQLFSSLRTSAQYFDYSNYSYIMILPWLISGGIDLFAVNYLNTIAELHPDQHILVLLTNDAHPSFDKEALGLATNITLIDYPKILKNDPNYKNHLPELIYSIINSFHPDRLHIIASKAGYDCLIRYGDQIRTQGTKILFSSYNYLLGPHGEYTGYTVQELPHAYRPGDIITTDNLISKKIWVDHFGFIANDILIHHQLFDCSAIALPVPSSKDGLNILWAAHIRPEKNPEILPKIAQSLQPDKVNIDCYGFFSSQNWANGENPLETNVHNLHYKGPYNNFFKDIDLSKYDLFLYTSHSDGTPNVIIEAALAGLPIVTSRIGGIPETLGNRATFVEDTSSVSQFVQAIRSTLSNLPHSCEQAKILQESLIQKHTKSNFIKQVKIMLERSQP